MTWCLTDLYGKTPAPFDPIPARRQVSGFKLSPPSLFKKNILQKILRNQVIALIFATT
jgi:hypothetical protein